MVPVVTGGVVAGLVAWWRELRARPVPVEPAGGWFWWEYHTPPEILSEPARDVVVGRLLVRRDGSWRA